MYTAGKGQGLQQRWFLDGSWEGFGSGNSLKICSQTVGALGPCFAEGLGWGL